MSAEQADKTRAFRPSDTQWLELEFTSKGLGYHLADPNRDSSKVVASFKEELGDLKTLLFGDRLVDLRNITSEDLKNVTPFGKRVLHRQMGTKEKPVNFAVYFAKTINKHLKELEGDDLGKRDAALKSLQKLFSVTTKIAEKHTEPS